MRKFQRKLFVLKAWYICYYMISMTVPLTLIEDFSSKKSKQLRKERFTVIAVNYITIRIILFFWTRDIQTSSHLHYIIISCMRSHIKGISFLQSPISKKLFKVLIKSLKIYMNKKFAKLQSNSKYNIKSFKVNIQKCQCLIDF